MCHDFRTRLTLNWRFELTDTKKKNNKFYRIRTGDLRRVKAGDSGPFEAFLRGEITTRKASAPF